MNALPPIDWKHWHAWHVPALRFERRREPYLGFPRYEEVSNDIWGGMAMVTTEMPKHLAKAKPGDLMVSTRRRLWDVLDWLSLQYSAGAPVAMFAEVWPYALEWAEEYAQFHEAYHRSPESDHVTPHVALVDNEYWIAALRLVCFGLLSGYAEEMPRAMAVLDYANATLNIRDGLLERLVAPFVPGRGTPPNSATRHLPYRLLFAVFDAAPEQRPALMVDYLDGWYHNSRHEPYTDQHQTEAAFYGYWSWEAAAVTWLLEIDDSTYRDMPFYPRDLVDFARGLPRQAGPSVPPGPTLAGQPCPRGGYWSTEAKRDSRQHFEAGQILPEVPREPAKGLVLWRWDAEQEPSTALPPRQPLTSQPAEPARIARSGEAAPRAGLWQQVGEPSVQFRAEQAGASLPHYQGQALHWEWLEQPGAGLRAVSGQPCPYPGTWSCEDWPTGPQTFMHGVLLPQVEGRNVTWKLVRGI